MGRAYVIASEWLRDKLYAVPGPRGDIRVIDDRPYDDEGNRLLTVYSPTLPSGMNGMRALVIDGDTIRLQPDVDT